MRVVSRCGGWTRWLTKFLPQTFLRSCDFYSGKKNICDISGWCSNSNSTNICWAHEKLILWYSAKIKQTPTNACYTHVHSSTSPNYQKVDTSQLSINWWMDKQIMGRTYMQCIITQPEICMYCGTEQGTLKTGEFTSPVTVHFIAFFLCKMSLDPEGEAPARQWVKWQVDKMVVILEAVVPSQSLYAGVGMRPKSETASRRTRRYCY